MNYFDLLPDDVSNHILNIRDNNSADIIIHYWQKRVERKISIVFRVIVLPLITQLSYSYYNPRNRIVSLAFEDASRLITLSDDLVWWRKKIGLLVNGILFYREHFLYQFNQYYYRSYISCILISTNLKFYDVLNVLSQLNIHFNNQNIIINNEMLDLL